MLLSIHEISSVGRPIRIQQEPLTVVFSSHPFAFVHARPKTIGSLSFELTFYKLAVVDSTISKFEYALYHIVGTTTQSITIIHERCAFPSDRNYVLYHQSFNLPCHAADPV